MIIGSIAAISIFLWFYHTAPRYDKNPLNWAIAGFVVYLMVAAFWTYAVNPGIKDAAIHGQNTMLMYISRYAYIMVAVVCAVAFNFIVGKKKDIDS